MFSFYIVCIALRNLSNDKLVKDKEIRGQRVYRLLNRPGLAALDAQQVQTISLWVQAPHQAGPFTLRLLFYYSLPTVANSPIKYRLVRHIWQLQVESCLQADSTCVVSNAVTNELGLDVNVRNQHAVEGTEVYINSISLYSTEFKLNPDRLHSKLINNNTIFKRCNYLYFDMNLCSFFQNVSLI